MRGRRRRLRGEGSIWRRKDGRYGAATRVVVDGIERRWQVTRASRGEVIAELKRLQRVGMTVSGRDTFGEWLDAWLIGVKTSTRPKTYESYEAVVRLWLKPVAGDRRLARLEPWHISAAMVAAKKAGLSTSSQAYVRTIARIALESALKLGKVMRNVAKLTPSVRVERSEIQPFTDAEFIAFMNAISGDRLEAAYLLAIVMGPRKGEILGLQWRDVLERGQGENATMEIRIARQVQRVDGRLRVAPVKTKHGLRAISLPRNVADAVRVHRVAQLEEKMKAGERWQETGHVFTTKIGTPIDPRNILADFYAKLKAAKIKPRRPFHALRHEAATALLVAGADIKAISAVLGHSSERFTHDTYTHLVPAMAAKLNEAAGARFKKK